MEKKTNISLFLISFSLFLYQVCLLRIFSISDYYHFAFMIVSIALLGFGISGSFLYFFIGKVKSNRLIALIFSFGFAASIIISFLAINLIPFDSFKIAWETRQLVYLVIYYLFLILPFFFGGSFIGYAFYFKEKPGITYFYNLIGSAAGAMSAIFIIQSFLGREGIIYISTAVGLVATIILLDKKNLKVFGSLIIIFTVSVSSLILFKPGLMEVRMSPYKSLPTVLRYPESEVVYTKENAYAKVDVINSPSIKSAPGISLKYQKVPPEQMGITLDGNNLSTVVKAEKNLEGLEFLNFMPQAVFFESSLKERKRPYEVLIIEPGGGLDVASALYFDSRRIDVVQNNNIIIEILKNNYADFNGNIYNHENVRVYEVSSRNFAKTADKKYDLIILSLSDSFHPISAGAYSLNENYLYTVQSFQDLLGILSENGRLVVTRWIQFPPSENIKVLSTLVESCKNADIGDVSSRIFAFRSWSTLTTILNKSGFTDAEINSFISRTRRLNFDLVYYKDIREENANIYNRLEKPYFYNYFKTILEGNETERLDFYKNYYFNIYPCTDDRPYFFNFFRFGQIPDIIKYFGKSTRPFGGGGYLILVTALIISVILSVLFMLLPLQVKRMKINLRKDFKYIVYFFCLGFGFFFIEIPFIQKFILILGKPAFALSIVLFSIMLAGGVGSYMTSRFNIRLEWVVTAIVIYVAVYIFSFRFIGDFIITRVLWQRFLYSILLILPLGFMMGIPFPSGMAKLKQSRTEVIPWAWAINGCTSVVGSITAVIVSIHFGFLVVIGIAAVIYIIAVVTYRYF